MGEKKKVLSFIETDTQGAELNNRCTKESEDPSIFFHRGNLLVTLTPERISQAHEWGLRLLKPPAAYRMRPPFKLLITYIAIEKCALHCPQGPVS